MRTGNYIQIMAVLACTLAETYLQGKVVPVWTQAETCMRREGVPESVRADIYLQRNALLCRELFREEGCSRMDACRYLFYKGRLFQCGSLQRSICKGGLF